MISNLNMLRHLRRRHSRRIIPIFITIPTLIIILLLETILLLIIIPEQLLELFPVPNPQAVLPSLIAMALRVQVLKLVPTLTTTIIKLMAVEVVTLAPKYRSLLVFPHILPIFRIWVLCSA